ncbi:MAG TPA: alpha/beta hydrolase [Steroidobacteraceae bacterium]|nr:alpha/beta hydrolase [Steroidobacteraceae bacterium]
MIRNAVAAFACVALAAACSRSGGPNAHAAGASEPAHAVAPAVQSHAASTAASVAGSSGAPAQHIDGAPLIVESPDLVHIEYRTYGHGEPAIVLVHGWSCSSAYWSAQLDDLKSHYTVVTVDLAGHGASGRNRRDWSMVHYGADVAAVVQHMGNAHVVLVGHSMGGPVVLEAAARLGSRVIGIIGVDTFKRIDLPPPARDQVEKQIEPFRADFIGEMHRFVPEFLFRKSTDPGLVRKVTDDMARAPPQIAIPTLVALNAMDFASVLQSVHVPIIAINSDFGSLTNEARIRKHVPEFRAIVLKGTDHFLMMDDARQFNPILLHEIAVLAGPDEHKSPAS